MTDPLDDPRAADLLAAQPNDIGVLAAGFRSAAEEAQSTAAGLAAARQDGTWTGKAATAFRDAIGRLPQQLTHVHEGYAEVARALSTYEDELSTIQAKFVAAADGLSTFNSYLGPAQTAAQTAHGSLATTATSKQASRSALTAAELAVARADGTLNRYRRQITALTGQAFALLDEFSTARDRCTARVTAAQRTAPVRLVPSSGTTVIDTGRVISPVASVFTTNPLGGGSAGQDGGLSRQDSQRIQAMIARADALLGTPYVYGGGHAGWGPSSGLDCSGFVSAVLRSGGYLQTPQTTQGFGSQPDIAAGRGRFVTIYDRTVGGPNEHVIIELNGHFYESGGGSASGGAPCVHRFDPSPAYLASFNSVLHPVGL